MDETVNDMIRIGELTYRMVKGLTATIIKIYNNAYYGKWYGQADFQKLHKIAGSHISYLEISTQDQEQIKEILSHTLDKYKVLYAPMPDLNMADGKSQIAFNADQSEAVKVAMNQYHLEKMTALKDAKERHGTGTPAYQKAKADIEAKYPTIRSINAEDYVLSRLDEHRKETKEYLALEKSAKDNLGKVEQAAKTTESRRLSSEEHTVVFPQKDSIKKTKELPTREKVIQFADAKRRVEYEDLIKHGRAQRLSVAEFQTEYLPIAEKEVPFYHAPLDDTRSVVLTESSLLDEKTAIIVHDKRYSVVSTGSKKIEKMAGKEVAEKMAKEATKRAVAAAKGLAKTAAKSNIATAAAEKVIEVADTISRAQQKGTGLDR